MVTRRQKPILAAAFLEPIIWGEIIGVLRTIDRDDLAEAIVDTVRPATEVDDDG